MSKFFIRAGEGLARKWLEWLFGPAFVFWAGGLLAVIGPAELVQEWEKLLAQPAPVQGGLMLAATLVLASSSALMQALRLPLLRFLEGYWFRPLHLLEGPLSHLWQWRIRRQREARSKLMLKAGGGQLTHREQRRLGQLEASLAFMPRDAQDVQPTRLGNILRTLETRPRQRYGLDPVLLWPRLWLLLPGDIRKALEASRVQMDRLVEAWGWGLLFAAWVWAAKWAVPIAVVWMGLSYGLLLQRAQVFCELVLATFDTQRWRLYEALRWPLPDESGDAEISAGQALTRFIQRGLVETPVRYAAVAEKPATEYR